MCFYIRIDYLTSNLGGTATDGTFMYRTVFVTDDLLGQYYAEFCTEESLFNRQCLLMSCIYWRFWAPPIEYSQKFHRHGRTWFPINSSDSFFMYFIFYGSIGRDFQRNLCVHE